MNIEKRGGYDYSDCSFEVRLTKRKFLHSVLRYVYFARDKIVVCKEPYQKKPEKIIKLNTRYTIKWIYNPKKIDRPFKEKAIGFSILNDKDESITQFYGDNIIMTCLLDFLQKQIFQADFLNEYEIITKIGKGKYAKVYKVKRKDTGELFAVKYLHKRKMKDIDDSEAALDNELNILRQLDHPNCLKLVACFQDTNGYYILTELLDESKSLSQEIAKYKNPQFSYKMIKHILGQLIKGLEYVHSKGIMHRDLKPQNIMFTISQSGALSQLKLIDFGLAQIIKSQKYIYVHVGTPGFVAPEILANESENHRYDEKCDLFSIGVIFHILLTGKTVFPGNKFSQVLEKNKLCQIQLSGARYEQISQEALDLLGKLLQKDPRRRISAKDALQHPFFSEKGSEFDKMPSCMETVQGVQMTKLKDEITNLPKRPMKTLSSLQDYDQPNGVSPTTIRANLFQQLNSLKSMKDIDATNETSYSLQTEALYKFTKDLIVLLEDIENNKEFLHATTVEEDYTDSPMKLQQKNKFFNPPISEQEENQRIKIITEIKKNKENSLINTIKVPERIEEEEEENNQVENQPESDQKNEELTDQDRQKIRDLKKNLCINTKMTEKSKFSSGIEISNTDNNINKNSQVPTQNNEDDEEQVNHIGRKIEYPPKNMILNEMPSPISPPNNFKLRPKLQLRIEKHQLQQQDSQGQFKQSTHIKFPKEIVQLIDFFPKDMFNCYLCHDREEIEKGMSKRVFKLGLFLLYGEDVLKQPAPQQILQKLEEITKKKKFHPWFIGMIKSMLQENESQRPSIKQLSQMIQKSLNPIKTIS
ncbi:Serine/Threonine kinase domain protein (macronuclear) [Tetrahymena thermophila SB210]|uniref:non-specific serine/threonine protein kinase n=1 Tax=Tetrahymena thermophila (strain SB210) TaxID=312017 RepID=I7MB86_TETTS|nr:Serine/Threonine kinase domain protein [Tetrahymena thermophila SB210]EAS07867.2 Serine/Threonine kinase domain protein [Tetrahymena thermophila SB210]|eukprot:XP_001028109.2 Serine/Threonine kinase domain protein [Tetrahymena thermophila SB210]